MMLFAASTHCERALHSKSDGNNRMANFIWKLCTVGDSANEQMTSVCKLKREYGKIDKIYSQTGAMCVYYIL